MTVIVAALGLIVGLWLFSVTTSDVGGFADELSGGSLTFSALFSLALSGTWLAVGINCARGRDWARITVIVGNAIVLVLVLLGAAAGDSDGGGVLLFLGWCGTLIALAATGKATTRAA